MVDDPTNKVNELNGLYARNSPRWQSFNSKYRDGFAYAVPMSARRHTHTDLHRDQFLEDWPDYADTAALDDLREREFARLDAGSHVYVDYTGAGMYPASLPGRHAQMLATSVLGNPHSTNPTSALSTLFVARGRRRVLEFFGASPSEYTVIFTANASHALKLVGESYPFDTRSSFILTFDNHNSVNGIREFDRARGAITRYVPLMPPDMRIPELAVNTLLRGVNRDAHNLFAFPAQSNFSGVQHPLEWIERAHDAGCDVLLDAAAFVPTNRLDLSGIKPDFATVSFYKMFGYPTGVGALIARFEALEKLQRPWFAGGTITVASVQADQYFLAPGAEGFEDGTLNYTSFPAIEMGLDYLDSVGIDQIHRRVTALTGWFIAQAKEIRHADGSLLVRVYGPLHTHMRGGTVTMNLYGPDGTSIDHTLVEQRANERNISLRTGCFCNPGAGEVALGLEKGELEDCFRTADARMTFDQFRQCVDGKSSGAVRISFGIASNFADACAVLDLLESFVA